MADRNCREFAPPNSGREIGCIPFLDRSSGFAAGRVHSTSALTDLDQHGHARVATAPQMALGNRATALNRAARM
jgi:hypothetical protein